MLNDGQYTKALSQINSTNKFEKKDMKLFNIFIIGFYTSIKLFVDDDEPRPSVTSPEFPEYRKIQGNKLLFINYYAN